MNMNIEDINQIEPIANITNWIVMIISILSMPMNIILLSLIMKRNIWALDLKLILLISVSDLTTSIVNIGFSISLLVHGHSILILSPIFCQSLGFIVILLIIASAIFIIALSFERYMILCHTNTFKEQIIWIPPIFVLSLIIIFGIISTIQYNFIPSSGHTYCIPDFQGNLISSIHYYIIFIISIAGLSAFNYLLIQIYFNRQRIFRPIILRKNRSRRLERRLREQESQSPLSNNSHEHSIVIDIGEEENGDYQLRIDEAKISKRIALWSIIYLLAYNLCFLPNFIAFLWDVITNSQRPWILDDITTFTIHLVELINPCLVLTLHNQINKEFFDTVKHLFTLFKTCINLLHPN